MAVCSRSEADALLGITPTAFAALITVVSPFDSRAASFEPDVVLPCASFESFDGQRLALEMDDVGSVMAQTSAPPTAEHLEVFFAFTDRLPCLPEAGLLIQCPEGVSRSPALAFALLCHRWGRGSEHDALAMTIRGRPDAKPNALIVELADHVLCRDGAMVSALARWRERRRTSPR